MGLCSRWSGGSSGRLDNVAEERIDGRGVSHFASSVASLCQLAAHLGLPVNHLLIICGCCTNRVGHRREGVGSSVGA